MNNNETPINETLIPQPAACLQPVQLCAAGRHAVGAGRHGGACTHGGVRHGTAAAAAAGPRDAARETVHGQHAVREGQNGQGCREQLGYIRVY